jgi:hypothetical protein
LTYAELKHNFKDHFTTIARKAGDGESLLIAAKNEFGENVVITHGTQEWNHDGKTWFENFFKIATAQHNGWTRYNVIFENGNFEEYYHLS